MGGISIKRNLSRRTPTRLTKRYMWGVRNPEGNAHEYTGEIQRSKGYKYRKQSTNVSGYTTSSGVYVRPHKRTLPKK